jgi:hypothetical protein
MSEATFIRDTAGFGEGEHSELRACGSRPPPWNTGPASEVVLGGNTPLDWMQPVPAGVVLHPSPFHRAETQRQVWQLHTQHTHVQPAPSQRDEQNRFPPRPVKANKIDTSSRVLLSCCTLQYCLTLTLFATWEWFGAYPLLVILMMVPQGRAAVALLLLWGLMGSARSQGKLLK